MSVDYFVEKIMFGLLKLDPRTVMFFQHHTSFWALDMSFSTGELFERVNRDIVRNASGDLLGDLVFSSSDVYATVVVQVYTPYLTTEDVALFLSQYCVEVRDGARIYSRHGLWMGRRHFRVHFRTQEDGRTYPPHPFYGEGVSVHRACWRCGAVGHRMADCSVKRCRYCGSPDHLAEACTAAKTCSACGSEGHLFRDCPLRSRTAFQESDEGQDGDQTFGGPHHRYHIEG